MQSVLQYRSFSQRMPKNLSLEGDQNRRENVTTISAMLSLPGSARINLRLLIHQHAIDQGEAGVGSILEMFCLQVELPVSLRDYISLQPLQIMSFDMVSHFLRRLQLQHTHAIII